MKKLFALLLFLFAFPLSPTFAQEGLFIRDLCTSITSPVTDKTFCLERTHPPTWKYWDGATWTVFGGAGGGGGSGNATYANAYASPPSSPASGDLWFPSDSPIFLRHNGSAWVPSGTRFQFTLHDDSSFAWINQGSATVSTTQGGAYITTPAAAGENVKIRKKAAPATPYTITAFVLTQGQVLAGNNIGLLFRQASDGKIHGCSFSFAASSPGFASYKWTNPTTFSATYTSATFANWQGSNGMGIWLRIADDGASRICSTSADGIHWKALHTIGRTDFLTADEVGYYVNAVNASSGASMWLLSWLQQ